LAGLLEVGSRQAVDRLEGAGPVAAPRVRGEAVPGLAPPAAAQVGRELGEVIGRADGPAARELMPDVAERADRAAVLRREPHDREQSAGHGDDQHGEATGPADARSRALSE